MELELPYPPSVNHYWRRVGARMLISRGGRAFRSRVCAILAARGVRPLTGPLDVLIELFPPDRRRRDADNAQKSLLDAFDHGGAYHDDSQIVHLDTWKREPIEGGKVRVRLTLIRDESDTNEVRSPVDMEIKKRTCLKCGKPFDSTGPANRICPPCQKINARIPKCGEAQLKQQRGEKRRNGDLIE